MRLRLYIAALLALATGARSARILGLFAHTGKSHQMVFDPLLATLADRGHHVTVASFFPFKNPPVNLTHVSLEGIAPVGLASLDLAWVENSNKVVKYLGLERIVNMIAAFQPLDEMALSVCSRLVDWPPLREALRKDYDLIILENFNSDCMHGLVHVYGHKAPIVAATSTTLMPWTYYRVGLNDNPSYVPILTGLFGSKMSFWERLENAVCLTYYKYWYRQSVQVKEQEILEKHFGKKLPDLYEVTKNISLVITNTHHSLHGVRPSLPAVVEANGMHLDHARKPIPEFMQRFLNESSEGVVLVSFGSLIRTSTLPKYKEDIIVKALSKLRQRVIWKYEDSGDEGTLLGNILKVKWVPQYELLRHHKVLAFFAHGGLLGITEAVSAGKPMVVMPFFGDQPSNAAMVREAGVAEVVSYQELDEKALYEALQKVVGADVRVKARRLSSIWWDRQVNPLDNAVYWMERVLRWGHEAPLHSSARDLSYIEIALLDVIATIVVALIVLLVILKYTLSLIPWFLGAGNKKDKIH